MATFNDQLKEIERFLLEWKEEMNCQYEELRECLRPIPNRGIQESSKISRNSRDTSNCDSGHSTMELEVGEEATQPDAMEDNSLTILGPILEDSSGEFSGVDGTDERQSTSLLFEPQILQSAVFNGDAMGLNRPSFLEGFKSENPSNPRLNPTPSNLGVRLNRVELGKEDHGVNGSRVLHTEMNNTMEDSTQEIVPSKVTQVGDGLFLDAHKLLEEMSMGDGSAKLQEMGDFEPLKEGSNLDDNPKDLKLLSRFGVHLDAEANSILQWKICEVLPSSEIGIGNVKFLELEFLEIDGMKCGGLVRDCEKPDFHAFGVSLGSWNLDLHPQVVDGNVGSKAKEFRVMNQPFLNAHEVFEKRSEKEMVNVDDSIGLLSTLRGVFGSIDFPSSIVFDSGKGLQLLSRIETVETIFVFDPGGLDFQWLVLCVVTDCVDVVAEFLLPYSY